jgi:YD repeat-containing protein
VSTTYEGNKTTVTDQAGRKRSVIKDGLGRTTKAFEDPADLNYETVYTYDGHDKLLTVKQGPTSQQQMRTYVYDSLGRLTQATDSNTYQMSYSYDLGGNMTSMTYPSGRIINTTYDAADRISAVSGIRPGTPGERAKTYVAMTSYTAHEVLKTMMLDNGLWEHTDSNQRLQLKEIGLGTSETDSSKVKLEFDYGTTANNGNMLSQKITVGASVINQSYGYDQLNRLTQVQESVNTVNRWTQNYGYDRFGNRTSLSNSGSESGLLPAQTTPAVNSLTNRLQSISYDQAGNPLSDHIIAAD